jgi:hypothetical protein
LKNSTFVTIPSLSLADAVSEMLAGEVKAEPLLGVKRVIAGAALTPATTVMGMPDENAEHEALSVTLAVRM